MIKISNFLVFLKVVPTIFLVREQNVLVDESIEEFLHPKSQNSEATGSSGGELDAYFDSNNGFSSCYSNLDESHTNSNNSMFSYIQNDDLTGGASNTGMESPKGSLNNAYEKLVLNVRMISQVFKGFNNYLRKIFKKILSYFIIMNSVLYTAYNTLAIKFNEELIEVFPKDIDFKVSLNTIKLIERTTKRKLFDLVSPQLLMYHEYIRNRDERFFQKRREGLYRRC